MSWVLVCGGRDYGLYGELCRVMDHLHAEYDFTVVVHGDAKGADSLADRWAEDRGIQRIKIPANWQGEGKAAGPIRNAFMLDTMKPDVGVVFPGGRGTHDMMVRMENFGVKVILAEEVIDSLVAQLD